MIKQYCIFLATIFFTVTSLGQSIVVKGKVTDEAGEVLPGATILERGTLNGSTTDFDGMYSITLQNVNAVLIYSYIGYETAQMDVSGKSTINISLQPKAEVLDGVVVTALGIKKESKTLGYASQSIDGDELTKATENNVVNSLSGKVAGVQINQSGTGLGGTSKVVIRGFSSIAGDNTPLYVIDGIPMLNPQGGGGQFGGVDYGDGISNISSSDIASVNVLKGPSATALYGSRGQNGVIMITTKAGKKSKGIGVEFSSNTVLEQALIFPKFQNKFGRGSNGNYPINSAGNFNNSILDSWGPLMQGQLLVNWTGAETPYEAQPDNIKDFFRTGNSLTNSIAFSGGSDNTYARFSISHLKNEGIVPNGNLERLNLNLNLTTKLTDKMTITAKANYIRQEVFNRPNLALSPDNPMNSLIQMPRNIRLDDLRDFQTADGQPRVYTNGSVNTWQNPYWAVNLNTNNDSRDRVIGFAQVEYELTDWLKVHLRSGTDFYNDFRQNRNATNTIYRVTPDKSFYSEYYGRVEERNTDILISSDNEISDKWRITTNFGANARKNTSQSIVTTAQGLNVPNFFVIQNALSTVTSEGGAEKKVNSVYGTVQLDYNGYLFIEGSARNDWSSALAPKNWSYFYPSVSTSFVFTDAFELKGDVLSFGKIRAAYAEVGNDLQPGQLDPIFVVNGLGHGGQAFGQIINTKAPTNLRPERTKSYEVGLDAWFFKNRIKLSTTYYYAGTEDQIIKAPVSKPSGFGDALLNAGLITNEGLEVTLNLVPVLTDNFKYETYFNFSKNVSKIKELAPNVEVYDLTGADYDQFGVAILAEVGGRFGDIYANKAYLRDPITGERIINAQGLPVEDPAGRKKIGNFQPDFLLGWGHNVSYKNFTLSLLLDYRKGGDIFSFSNSLAAANGNSFRTRDDRLEWYAGAGGYVASGVTANGDPNTVEVDPQTYWQNVGGRGSLYAEEFLYDGSFLKLREMTLGYTFPKKFLGNSYLTNLRVSLVGRNLFLLHSNTEGFDPEATFNSGNAQGIEALAIPSTRSVGINFNITL